MEKKQTRKVGAVQDSKRTLYFGNTELNAPFKYTSNFIKTSKYNVVTYLPKSILIQFERYANIYFLVTAILQCIPTISPLNPFSAILPLVIVIGIAVLREGYEDYLRHVSDKELNASECTIYRGGKFIKDQWANIHVGDILKVVDMEFFPADIVLFATSNDNGMCYIETSSLDGEKNLKPKVASKDTMPLFNSEAPTVRFEGSIVCDTPNPALYQYDGLATLFDEKKIGLSAKQLLLRGAKLKNTEWIIGVVAYTGDDTKVMRNAESAKNKQSNVEKTVNKCILAILGIELLFCLIGAIASFIWDILYLDGKNQQHMVYLTKEYNNGTQAVIVFFSFFLLLNTMIPISLIISLELIKLFQCFFIKKDMEMYNQEKNRFANASTSAIIEELGQVDYVFSDKTGTLTCNKMEFKLAMIGSRLYGDRGAIKQEEAGTTSALRKKPTFTDEKAGLDYSFDDGNLEEDLKTDASDQINLRVTGVPNYTISTQSKLIQEFMKGLALNHDCVLETDKDGNVTYQGPSPDEITLVDFARRTNYAYKGVDKNFKLVEISGREERFEVLQTFEFDSDRKRASVIIRDLDGTLKLYTKGADSIIKKRLTTEIPQPYLQKTDKKIDQFSVKGLRTLLIAMRIISASEYQDIDSKISKAVDAPNREQEINRIADEIEKNLTLIGATAVEDKLQDNVPETIFDLLRANIKVWMLTGDKLETAENIGRSCNLIQPHFEVMFIAEKSKEEVETAIRIAKGKFLDCVEQGKPRALLIEGDSLSIILENSIYTKETINIAKECEAVICCRVTPKQKADVVRMIKDSMSKITLAIGDGANDVNMIQEAHIGIGIYGQEGMRAVQASDFAIPEFQGLWRLLFVHGRWSYLRISEMIIYFFYKNMVFTLQQFFFAFIAAFGAQTVYDDWYITFYNLVFTSIPLLIRAGFDQDVYYKKVVVEKDAMVKKIHIENRDTLKKYYPLLYYMGQENLIFNVKNFWKTVAKGALHGVIIFLMTFFVMRLSVLNSDGYNSDMWYFSITLYTSIILVVDVKLAIYTKYWTVLMWLSLIVLSIGLYIAYVWVASEIELLNVYKTTLMLFSTPHFYLICALNTGIVFLADSLYVYVKKEYFTETVDYLRAMVKKGVDDDVEKFDKIEVIARKPRIEKAKKKRGTKKEAHGGFEDIQPKHIPYSSKNDNTAVIELA